MTMDANGNTVSSTGNQYFRSTEIAAEAGYIYASSNNTLNVISAEKWLPFVTNVSTGNSINDISVDNDIVYIASSNGLNLWDVADKASPYQIGTDNSGSLSNQGNRI